MTENKGYQKRMEMRMKELTLLAGDSANDVFLGAYQDILHGSAPRTFNFNGVRVIMFNESVYDYKED